MLVLNHIVSWTSALTFILLLINESTCVPSSSQPIIKGSYLFSSKSFLRMISPMTAPSTQDTQTIDEITEEIESGTNNVLEGLIHKFTGYSTDSRSNVRVTVEVMMTDFDDTNEYISSIQVNGNVISSFCNPEKACVDEFFTCVSDYPIMDFLSITGDLEVLVVASNSVVSDTCTPYQGFSLYTRTSVTSVSVNNTRVFIDEFEGGTNDVVQGFVHEFQNIDISLYLSVKLFVDVFKTDFDENSEYISLISANGNEISTFCQPGVACEDGPYACVKNRDVTNLIDNEGKLSILVQGTADVDTCTFYGYKLYVKVFLEGLVEDIPSIMSFSAQLSLEHLSKDFLLNTELNRISRDASNQLHIDVANIHTFLTEPKLRRSLQMTSLHDKVVTVIFNIGLDSTEGVERYYELVSLLTTSVTSGDFGLWLRGTGAPFENVIVDVLSISEPSGVSFPTVAPTNIISNNKSSEISTSVIIGIGVAGVVIWCGGLCFLAVLCTKTQVTTEVEVDEIIPCSSVQVVSDGRGSVISQSGSYTEVAVTAPEVSVMEDDGEFEQLPEAFLVSCEADEGVL